MIECKNKCEQYRFAVGYGSVKYGASKYCSKCCLFMVVDEIKCPCCSNRLRTRPRDHQTRKNQVRIRI